MIKGLMCASVIVGFIAVSHLYSQATADGAAPRPNVPAASAFLGKYCVTCHNARLKTAGLMLDRLDLNRPGDHAREWEKVISKLQTREMPPPGLPRPDRAAYDALSAQLENAIDAVAATKPNPGRVPIHRLNRNEYSASIRDLLGVDLNAEELLPADDSNQEGFDNLASVLTVSPLLMENYLSAAREVSRMAVNDLTLTPVIETFKVSKAMVQEDQMAQGLPFGSTGGSLIHYYFPLNAEYTLKVRLRRQEYDYLVGMGEPHQIEFRLDGGLLKRFTIGGEAKGRTMPETYAGNTQGGPEFEVYMHTADDGLELRVPVRAGEHRVGISFVQRFWEPEGVSQPPQTGFARTTNEYYHGNPAVEVVEIGGPYKPVSDANTPTRRKLFVCVPQNATAEEPCAKKILMTLATRAYRRPLTKKDEETLLAIYKEGRTGQTFSAGIQWGVERILTSPGFLFRIEQEPANAAPGTVYPLTDLELASRLSFFLWSSVPDAELLDLANRGKLRDPAVRTQQVQRMLQDPRADALVNNFTNRWLELNKLAGLVPDTRLYPEFDENLRQAMGEETRLFVRSQIKEDHNVVDLLTANYTFLNNRLAEHYGIANIYGSRFRRVTLSGDKRGGLLGQASVLSVTSYPNRTSVTIRGRWLLANLLGSPPPPPPANVPTLKDAGEDGQPRALRERMELHRKNPACASCHARMDPLGFALENFDADGKWRREADGVSVDARGSLPDGTHFDGLDGLRELLVTHRREFVQTLTGKLLSYAMGRGTEYYDVPAIRKITRDAARNDYRWSSILSGIVNSVPFTMGISDGAPAAQSDTTSPAGAHR